MEQETMLKEILHAFKLYSDKVDNKLNVLKNDLESKMDRMEMKMDTGFARIDERLERFEKKYDGMRVEMTESKETIDFILNKTAQHERKLQQLINQQL
ncbi:hypothetical protein [Bacillus sinesaloumensis]|uniref:hypothetical protein n=1 Tax=Litchfieldia sinesaloumensis TaxID=1926280 RepID=UPI0009887FA4|nr:hypothetical protein [Bacillus sinesaloumensis]